ncbi:MAG: 50S ribosomal protein L21 [bacterium]|nr:50S ribosomal protein L21 [bacterium]
MVETETVKKVSKKAPTKPTKALYAVFATGGKQYRVVVGDRVKIEKLGPSTNSGQVKYKEGDKLTFDKVLLVDDGASEATIGTPFIKGAEVKATLSKIARYKTIDVIKYKQKSRYFKKYGHRQPYFEIKIDSIK